MLTSGEINVIGNILNTTWAKSSTERGDFPCGTAPLTSIKGKLRTVSNSDGECQLVITFLDVINFRSQQEIQATVKSFRTIAQKTCEAKIKDLKQQFKGAAGRSLKLKYQSDVDSVESLTTHTPATSMFGSALVRPAMERGYYRYTCTYTVS